ncbi:VanZ family protein [Bacillus suaedae]|uniref:VanZ family protein n=1 Tax=Halalkalibacter suaedae TaxID=2822140 RepID=A0A940WUD0_9BACI|nr:VanZ family protein [Bacillus suaedae]MBP3952909.1 VanZ family protein [Bacillus suaedae]
MKDQRRILTILFILYLGALFYVTLFAWNYGASLGPAGPGGRNYNVIPFRSIYRIAVFSPTIVDPIRILIGNIVMFLPMGFLIPALHKRFRRFLLVVIIGAFVSLCIEMSQFMFTYRVSNIDDIILNTLGTAIGYLIFSVLLWLKRKVHFFV